MRNDSGVYEGAEIPIYYDPMIAKLITWGSDRAQAIERMKRALAELRLEGIATSAPLFRQILDDEDFRAGRLDITMLERKMKEGVWGSSRGLLDRRPADRRGGHRARRTAAENHLGFDPRRRPRLPQELARGGPPGKHAQGSKWI